MILALDIGNSNIKAALFEGLEQKTYSRISCDRNKSSDEYGVTLLSMLRHAGYGPKDVTGIVFSSVVPTINFTIEHMCRNYFGIEPMSVQPGIKTGINIKYENPRELGSDRIANAVAALDCDVRTLTRDAGVDVMSFGGTKNGLMMAESVVIFNQDFARDFPTLRKQNLILASKMRFLAAQYVAYFTDDL